jgi:hypothetical protein
VTPAQEKALRLALHVQYPAFPCLDTKAPVCPHGFKDACTATTGLGTLWARYPGELVGVPTGSVSGLAVLDIDPRNGGTEWWLANKDRLPPTRKHRTRSGGIHAVFKHRAGLKCSNGGTAPGVDIKAEGGYVVWWPLEGLPVDDQPLADWPECLTPKEEEPEPRAPLRPRADGLKYSPAGARRLRGLVKEVESAPEGQRNGVAFWAGCRLGELVIDGAVELAAGVQLLIGAAKVAGLPPWEARAAVNNGLSEVGL